MLGFASSILVILAGCGRLAVHHPATPASLPARAELERAYEQRLSDLEAKTKDQSGWPSAIDCDGTVWAGTACLAGAAVDISLAAYAPGEIHRRPKASGECYGAPPPHASSSTVSRDDLVLYMACAWHLKAAGLLADLQVYAGAHPASPKELGSWMGEPHDPDLTLMTPTLEAILARATASGGGVDIEAPGVKDFQDHIEVEEVLLSADVNGGANGWELGLLKELVGGSPKDALFQAALGVYTGRFDAATSLLLDPGAETPSYVRGGELYPAAWWLRTANLVLDHTKE